MARGSGPGGLALPGTRTVLLVQGAPALRERLSALLAELPCARLAATATSTQEALVWLTALEFDAVLVDLALLAPSRLEALRVLRRAAPGASLVVLAGAADAESRERCRALGADHVLGSAVEFERLGDILEATGAPRPAAER